MISEFKEKSEKIIEANSAEIHKLKLKMLTDKYDKEIIELKDFIKMKNEFELVHLEVLNNLYVTLSIKLHVKKSGKYYIS
jgi:hypothetical protein